MSVFENPSFYISLFSSICFIASEILAFAPTQGNGILHTAVGCLAYFNRTQNHSCGVDQPADKKDIYVINKKLDLLIFKIDRIV